IRSLRRPATRSTGTRPSTTSPPTSRTCDAMSDDNPYDSLAEETDDHRWAFGTGFVDPLEGIDTSVPEGMDAVGLAAQCLMLVGRLLIFATWRLAMFERLTGSADPVLAAIAAKGVNELAYHRDYAAQWVVRLGDGTELSKQKMQAALETIWPLVDELFDSEDD